MWCSVGVVCVGFFQPWVRLEMRQPGVATSLAHLASSSGALAGLGTDTGRMTVTIRRGTRTITGDLSSLEDFPRQISGAQVPQIANAKNAQLAVAIMELLTNTRQRIGLKSYVVYLVPGTALLCGILLTVFGGRPLVAFGVAGLGLAVAGAGYGKLLTANLHALVVVVDIAHGLWMSLGAYLGLAAAGLLSGLSATRARP